MAHTVLTTFALSSTDVISSLAVGAVLRLGVSGGGAAVMPDDPSLLSCISMRATCRMAEGAKESRRRDGRKLLTCGAPPGTVL